MIKRIVIVGHNYEHGRCIADSQRDDECFCVSDWIRNTRPIIKLHIKVFFNHIKYTTKKQALRKSNKRLSG